MPGSREDGPQDEVPERVAWKGAAAVAVVVAGLVVWRALAGSGEGTTPAAPGASAGGSAAAAPASAAVKAAPRCSAAAAPFVVDVEKPRRKADGEEEEQPDQLAPFAVELGRGAAVDGGFAAGALREGEAGAVAMVAFVGADGSGGRLVRLARSRGDLEPPAVAGAGKGVIAAMLEPNAAGRAIRVAKVEGEEVTWGPELSEGRDESLAVDVAVSGERAVVVWDDVTSDGERSRIMMSSVDTASLRSVTSPRPISAPKVDAEVPRVVARPGGYWLAYIARAEELAAPDKDRKGAKKPKKALAKGSEVLDEDTEAPGERIAHQWIEVMPLDETGSPVASARAVTPRDGHVLALDLTLGDEGGALLAYRDNDTPSGSSGGKASVLLVGLGQVGEPRVVAGEDKDAPPGDAVGSGVPALLPGWLALSHVSGATRLAGLSARGEILDGLAPEESLGGGEPIAAGSGALLVAKPAGTAVKLTVLRCAPGAAIPGPGAPGAADPAWPAVPPGSAEPAVGEPREGQPAALDE